MASQFQYTPQVYRNDRVDSVVEYLNENRDDASYYQALPDPFSENHSVIGVFDARTNNHVDYVKVQISELGR